MSIIKNVDNFFGERLTNSEYYEDWLRSDKLIAAVSGGPDSLVLLHLLTQQDLIQSKQVIVAHLNHGLRPEAKDEAEFVQATAAAWNHKVCVEQIDVNSLSSTLGLSLEEAGRVARLDFLARVADKEGGTFIAMGHNADDQAETVLMHFLRGTGLAGLRGMLPVSPMTNRPELFILRPLLYESRNDIEDYCRRYDLSPTIDQSNTDTTFYRNWLRYDLIPLLTESNPQIKRRLQNTAQIVAADYDLLDELIQKTWSSILVSKGNNWLILDGQKWRNLHLSLRRATLRKAVGTLKPNIRDLGYRTVEDARIIAEDGKVGHRASLPGNIILINEYQNILLAREKFARLKGSWPQLSGSSILKLKLPGKLDIGQGWTINVTETIVTDMNQPIRGRDPWVAFVDVGTEDELIIRSRRKGERFQPLGLKGKSAKVSDVMINHKIPSYLRAYWPIVAITNHLVWLVGHHTDDRVRVKSSSQRILVVSVEYKGHKPNENLFKRGDEPLT